jgi:hypothetical protein
MTRLKTTIPKNPQVPERCFIIGSPHRIINYQPLNGRTTLYTTPDIESRDNFCLFEHFSLFYTCKDNQRMLSIPAIIVRPALTAAGKKAPPVSCDCRHIIKQRRMLCVFHRGTGAQGMDDEKI